MGVVVNENVTNRGKFEETLNVSKQEVKDFEKVYGDFMRETLGQIASSEDGITALEVLDKVEKTFTGKNARLFLSQITSQAFITILEVSELEGANRMRDLEPLKKLFGDSLDEIQA